MTEQELKALARGYYGVDGYVWHEDVVMRLFEENARMREALVDIEYLADDGADYCTDKGSNNCMQILSVARGALK